MITVTTKKKGQRATLRVLDAERIRHEQIEHAREMAAKEKPPALKQEPKKRNPPPNFPPIPAVDNGCLPGHWLLSAAGVIDKAVTMTPELDAASIEYLRGAAKRCREIGKALKEAHLVAEMLS